MVDVRLELKEFKNGLKEKCEIAQRFAKDYVSCSGTSLFILQERHKKINMDDVLKTYFVLREIGYSVDSSARYSTKFHDDIAKLTFALPKEKLKSMRYEFYETRAGRPIPALRAYYELRKKKQDGSENGIRTAISIILSPKETRKKETNKKS